ncbi:MAG: ABC-2 transporter permease [Lachnospiraceae bacterium]|nr:ABC-2 transporter permease [Lachnospiraceae bacterium]
MKKGTFKGLLFREFYVARKTIVSYFLIYIFFIILALLALLSYKCGNLHRYAHLINEETTKMIDFFIKIIPVTMAIGFTSSGTDSTPNDEKTPWQRFRTACPVTPFRLALAKYACTLILFLFSLGLTFGWLGLHSLLTGSTLTRDNIVIIAITYSFIMVLIAYVQNISIWLRTMERVILAIMIPMYGGLFFVFIKFPQIIDILYPSNPAGMNKLVEGCTKLLPFAPLIFAGSLLVGILCTTMLYKRREK